MYKEHKNNFMGYLIRAVKREVMLKKNIKLVNFRQNQAWDDPEKQGCHVAFLQKAPLGFMRWHLNSTDILAEAL